MRHNNTGGHVCNRPSIDFTRMRNNGINGANKDNSLGDEFSACINGEHNKMFLPMTRDVTQKRQNIDSSKQPFNSHSSHIILDLKSMGENSIDFKSIQLKV